MCGGQDPPFHEAFAWPVCLKHFGGDWGLDHQGAPGLDQRPKSE